MLEKSENFNSLRPILFELSKKKTTGGGQIDPPPSRNRVNSIVSSYALSNITKLSNMGLIELYIYAYLGLVNRNS